MNPSQRLPQAQVTGHLQYQHYLLEIQEIALSTLYPQIATAHSQLSIALFVAQTVRRMATLEY